MTEAGEVELLYITGQFVAAQEAGLQPRVADYVRRYPQYANEITDFVTYYFAMETDLPLPADTVPPLSIDAQAALRRGWTQAEALPIDTSVTLLTLARSPHGVLPRLATALDLSLDLVEQLVSRQLDPATLPYELVRRLAQALEQPVDSIQRALGVTEGQRKRMVAELPLAYNLSPLQSFRQAIAGSSRLSASQEEYWQRILEGEGL